MAKDSLDMAADITIASLGDSNQSYAHPDQIVKTFEAIYRKIEELKAEKPRPNDPINVR